MRVFEAQPFFTPPRLEQRFLPEGPRVLQTRPLLGWVSIQHAADAATGSINVLNLETLENDEHILPGHPGFFAETTEPGVLVVGMDHHLALYDLAKRELRPGRIQVTDDPRVMINEGLAVENGLLFGTKHKTFTEKIACLYYFDGTLHVLDDKQICSNGKFLKGNRLIDIDSFKKTIDEFAVDLPRLGERRVVADLNGTPLFPDGLRPSPDGESVIVAFYNPEPAEYGVAREIRIADGAVLTEWRLPGSPRVTCPEFVAIDGKVKILFTTAIEGMDPVRPLAGALFIADTPFDKVPAAPPLFQYNAQISC